MVDNLLNIIFNRNNIISNRSKYICCRFTIRGRISKTCKLDAEPFRTLYTEDRQLI